MAKQPPKKELVSPMEDEESRLEPRPKAAMPETRRAIGKLDKLGNEDSVSLTAPNPVKKGRREVPRAAVGFRAATEATEASPKAVESRTTTRQKVREGRDQHRQRVWDKLDAARKVGDDRRGRFERFQPARDDDSSEGEDDNRDDHDDCGDAKHDDG
ncbi:MAG: hypothetical protein V3T05_12450 [Myxococcota bacterium]